MFEQKKFETSKVVEVVSVLQLVVLLVANWRLKLA